MAAEPSKPDSGPAPQNEENIELQESGEPPMLARAKGFFHSLTKEKLRPHSVWLGALAAGAVIAMIIVAAVVGSRHKEAPYPKYSRIKYRIAETYEGEGFFDKFNFFTGYDPAQGFVHYVPEKQAREMNLSFASRTAAVIRVDTSVGPDSSPDASTGRFSVRLESKSSYNGGLFIFDVSHAPLGCGAWPALWLADTMNWPMNGEIDVLEATNFAIGGNLMTLHTSKGCTMGVLRKHTDKALHTDCDASKNSNAGCGVQNGRDSFGGNFNKGGGGVIALEWRQAGIRMWQFPRSAVPGDISHHRPDPSSWATATADFPSTQCKIEDHFRNNSIVLNIDLCGPLVLATLGETTCPSNCTDIVANRPDFFHDAYWEVKSFRIYQPII